MEGRDSSISISNFVFRDLTDEGEVISVTSATYGRSDQNTCITGSLPSQITNVQCSNSSNKVAQSCNGKQNCSITAENSVFGDPCVGTYKYLEVEYSCECK
ncbi:L-rhamnose-binding lectin CSL3-like [Poecilia reticulata]|uniref:L-rhamnose-binding lectin CSL3-like n=1 Tax=Poecilia reticulata TaxID=8081 RepID=UPI0004A47625|nr:PREDICTED: L-rhamnose-binding lectin CSL3-like [Poecilia reticulata]